MSYDIYGNALSRGCCEVHPHIHEEYPCSLCFAEQQIFEYMKEQNDEMFRRYEADMRADYEKSQPKITWKAI